MNPFLATDGYKTGHVWMYPKGTSFVYSNFTPRSDKHAPQGVEKGYIIAFGQQMVMKQIHHLFKKHFFKKKKRKVCREIKKAYSTYLNTDYDVSHIEALHDLGYLPIEVKSLPEGAKVPIGVPVLTIYNTLAEFYWVTNFLETLLSNLMWKPMTSATIAYNYKKNLLSWANKTDKDNTGFVDFQGHDFSMRGMDSLDATISSSLGHAISFLGSDNIPAIWGARKFYHHPKNEGVVYSVNATEHSVMCAGGKEDELETFRNLMKAFPTGVLSIVSDTWDLWKVCTEILPQLKDEILARDGKIVIRPDSGDPVDIICGRGLHKKGNKNKKQAIAEHKGLIELLWDLFGGTINEQGYKVLDPHIGAIYGDSITLARAEEICSRLEEKRFASTNIVLGIGSFTYQYNTRDTFGFAMKATYVELEEHDDSVPYPKMRTIGREIFKDPVTDDGTKKSAKGLLKITLDKDGNYVLQDQVSKEEEKEGELKVIYCNGGLTNPVTFNEIRQRVNENIKKEKI